MSKSGGGEGELVTPTEQLLRPRSCRTPALSSLRGLGRPFLPGRLSAQKLNVGLSLPLHSITPLLLLPSLQALLPVSSIWDPSHLQAGGQDPPDLP